MGAEEKHTERVREELRLTEKIMLAIPGFKGYKEKELRRESDGLIRNRIYTTMRQAIKEAKEVYRDFVNANFAAAFSEADSLVSKLDRIAERIHHAEYGYTGFWDAVKVREEELDAMLRFDVTLIDSSGKILDEVKLARRQIKDGKYEEALSGIRKLTNEVDDLDETFNRRKEVILGISPK